MKDALVPVLVIVALLVVAGLTLFFVRRPRRGALPPEASTKQAERPVIERGRQIPTDVIAPPAPTEQQPVGEKPAVDKPTVVPAPAPAPPVEQAPPVAPPPVVEAPQAPAEPVAPEIETPEPTAGRLVRLRARLARSQNVFGKGLLGLLSRDHLDDDAWDEVEESLISADVGVQATTEIVAKLRERTRVLGTRTTGDLRRLLTEELTEALDPKLDRSLHTGIVDGKPSVILVVGVNGAGKTTSCGKIARVLVADGHTVVLGAADTFRAAAADQLATWASRVGAQVVRGPEGGDPAAVAFDAVKKGIDAGVDTVLIDTAGRLQNKVGLMDELGKIKRVVEKHGPVSETLLVLDATAGQNGLSQARVFTEVADVTGVVLTKLDGTAKGGIVIAVQRALGIPVKLVGLGEGPDDLAPFDPQQFVTALLGDE
ncbi:signal recognition particle-docking protein FtsY [Catellatospora sp. NPDC049609]|uniref:signal recognition particle-docking protein FtsY n=1 Tax=Catellatospora sp. NPDC049609 TaxID=3155505 RepID=UPI00342A135A